MKFNKKDLEFLYMYSIASKDDIFQIITSENKIHFIQFSVDIKFVTTLDNVEKENINITLNTSKFVSLLKLCKDDDIIEILQDKIKFGNRSSYKLQNYEFFSEFDINNFENILNNNIESSFKIKDFDKIKKIKQFISNDKYLNTFAIMNNHFISFNGTVLAITKTENNLKQLLYFPKILYDLIVLKKLKNIDFIIFKENSDINFFVLKIDNTVLYIPNRNEEYYKIPYVFDPEIIQLYNHPYKSIVNKIEFEKAFEKIKIISDDYDSKVIIEFNKDNIKLKSISKEEGYEIITAQNDVELNNFYIILELNYLLNVINNFKGAYIIFNVLNNKEELNAIKITDDINNEFNKLYFVHRILEYPEENKK